MTEEMEKPHEFALADAQRTAREFIECTLPEVKRIDFTKMAPTKSGEAGWDVEADVWQPNATLETLGIETQRPVLDQHHYLLRIDSLLNVLGFELHEGDENE
jgi:hypothetical protein